VRALGRGTHNKSLKLTGPAAEKRLRRGRARLARQLSSTVGRTPRYSLLMEMVRIPVIG
jgi:hypothetical protein